MIKKNVIGIDIGGTKISSAIVSSGEIIDTVEKTNTPYSKAEILESIYKLIEIKIKDFKVDCIGICTAGVVDNEKGTVVSATNNLPEDYVGLELKRIIEDKYFLPTFIENDANAATYGEFKSLEDLSYKNIVVVTIGTGIGSGIIINNELYRGSGFAAGECGHFPIQKSNKRKCNCGLYDCWEVYGSGVGLLNTAKKLALKENKSDAFINNITTYTIIENLNNNDIFYKKVYNQWQHNVLQGLMVINNMLTPDAIILGGSMSQFLDYSFLNDLIQRSPISKAKIIKAMLGNNSGIIGVAMLAANKYLSNSEIILNK